MRLLFIFATLFFLQAQSQSISYPLRASANKKYLVDQNGKPVFLNGCSSWDLPFALHYQQVKQFLTDRKAKGFNAVLVRLSPDPRLFKNGSVPAPVYGADAFTDDDIARPGEKYFRHVDSVLNLCEQMGICVLVAPLYLGCCQDGWLETIQKYANPEQKCRQYGEWIANRYKHLTNLIWVSGGDHDPIQGYLAMSEGIASVDTIHLHTFHAHPGKTSGEKFKGAKWQTLSAAYTYFPALEMNKEWQYHHVYEMFYEENLNNYDMPCFLIESAYEHERNATTQIIRRQAYWALISGATGHMYGEKDTYAFTNNWNAALNAPGAESMRIFDAFIKTVPWYKLKPDWPHTVFTGGRGYFNPTELPGGEDYATGAVTTDSTMAILYMPTSRTVCVNMGRLKSRVHVKWFDPSSGTYQGVPGDFPNSNVAYFTPPARNNSKGFDDWVLMLSASTTQH